uniref:Uncharacterized protein n=1 Tax=Trypanosoma congolense (strain IL3000) TaxID=1068625 RepID=G0V0Q7_TRYCI|nr:conserved hypothetical protein [Trypanosoma congolense IL3000]
MYGSPSRNPFKSQNRTNLPPFSECLQSIHNPADFCSFGESMSAASPPSRHCHSSSHETMSPRPENVDYSLFTMEISDLTSPGTPPPQVERYHQICVSTPSNAPQSLDETYDMEFAVEDGTCEADPLPPLFPSASPIERSPSVAPGISMPRTEPQEVHAVEPEDGRGISVDLKEESGVCVAVAPEWPAHVTAHHFFQPEDYTPSYEDLLLEDCGGVYDRWSWIKQKTDQIIPPLRDSIGGDLISDHSHKSGDFAYHHPHIDKLGAVRRFRRH